MVTTEEETNTFHNSNLPLPPITSYQTDRIQIMVMLEKRSKKFYGYGHLTSIQVKSIYIHMCMKVCNHSLCTFANPFPCFLM